MSSPTVPRQGRTARPRSRLPLMRPAAPGILRSSMSRPATALTFSRPRFTLTTTTWEFVARAIRPFFPHWLLSHPSAKKAKQEVEIVEWPGGEPKEVEINVSPELFMKVERGRNSIPLERKNEALGFGRDRPIR